MMSRVDKLVQAAYAAIDARSQRVKVRRTRRCMPYLDNARRSSIGSRHLPKD